MLVKRRGLSFVTSAKLLILSGILTFLYKLHDAGVASNVRQWFKNYLTDQKQRVVLPGISSAWNLFKAGVPQDSFLGPLLF